MTSLHLVAGVQVGDVQRRVPIRNPIVIVIVIVLVDHVYDYQQDFPPRLPLPPRMSSPQLYPLLLLKGLLHVEPLYDLVPL